MGKVSEYIPEGHKNAIKREDLRILTGLDDRTLRDQINKSDELIINMGDGEGYFKPSPEDYHLVIMWERTFWKRIKDEARRARLGAVWREEMEKECDIYCPGEEDENI